MPRERQNEFSTDAELKSIEGKAKDKPRKEWRDAETKGLVFVTQPSGSCAWYLFYTLPGTGLRKLKLGEYGQEMGLKKAREIAVARRKEIIDGKDPIQVAKAAKAKALGLKFQGLAERFLAENDRLAATTRMNYRYALEKDAYPAIGNLPVDDVTREDVIAICQKIERRTIKDAETGEKRKPTSQSDHTRATISAVYSWAIEEGLAAINPARDIKRRGIKVKRDRAPSNEEIAALWQGVEGKLSTAMRSIVRLAILTGQRRAEVAGTKVSELQGLDTDEPMWVIPGDVNKRGKLVEGRTKNGRTQYVPLSRQAAEIFKQAVKECAKDGFLFPADHSRVKHGKEPRYPHIAPDSVTQTMIRLREDAGVADITIHDMRRAISNWLKDQGISREVRDLILNHVDGSITEANYTQNARMTVQVRHALQIWADHVWKITGQKAEAVPNVVALRA